MNEFLTILTKLYQKELIEFIKWYKVSYANGLDAKTFISLPLNLQLYTFLKYIQVEYNTFILVKEDKFSLVDRNMNIFTTIYFKNDNIDNMYAVAILKVFDINKLTF